MTSRQTLRDERGRDRRRPARDEQDARAPDPPTSSRGGRGEPLNEFFVNGKGIHREVLQREICKYLGPEAYSRPSSYNGVSGFTVTAVRPFTSTMLDDLQELSRSYELEKGQANRRGQGDFRYEDSRTHQQAARNQGLEDPYNPGGYQPQVAYSAGGAQSNYLASSRPEYPPTPAGAYGGSPYAQAPGYTQGPAYLSGSAYPSAVHPSIQDSYNAPYDHYGDDSAYSSYPGGPRREVRVEPRPDLRDSRIDPRAELRRPDPRSYAVQDPRPDPRADTRLLQNNYSYSVAPPADVSMRYNDDYANPPVQMGRGTGPYAPSRVVQTGYDPRESPQMRDGYRHEPIREETRRRR